MSDELKACPGCGKTGMETPMRLESFPDCQKEWLFGCVHCGIYTRTREAWDALPRSPGPATKLVIDRLNSACEYAAEDVLVRIHMVGEEEDVSFLSVGEVRAFVAEREAAR